MDNNVKTQTYTLMLICGTELGRDEAARVNKMKVKYRILPKQFGEYDGEKVFEIEKFVLDQNLWTMKVIWTVEIMPELDWKKMIIIISPKKKK